MATEQKTQKNKTEQQQNKRVAEQGAQNGASVSQHAFSALKRMDAFWLEPKYMKGENGQRNLRMLDWQCVKDAVVPCVEHINKNGSNGEKFVIIVGWLPVLINKYKYPNGKVVDNCWQIAAMGAGYILNIIDAQLTADKVAFKICNIFAEIAKRYGIGG